MALRGDKRATRRRVAVFAMPEPSHWQRMRLLVSGLVERGLEVHVFTDRRLEPGVARTGAAFIDLFGPYPLEAADDESRPRPLRYVSFAGVYADQIVRDLSELRPDLVLYDTFAPIGQVAAKALGVPYVNVCSGHNRHPDTALPQLRDDPLVRVSASCERAVESLREVHGIEDASPFMYVSALSPSLNVYAEPPEFLAEEERAAFEPIAFFGSLPPPGEIDGLLPNGGAPCFPGAAETKVYVSFGTVIWRYFAADALAALGAIAGSASVMEGVHLVISLGGAEVPDETRRALEGSNVSVVSWLDQWRALSEADVFVTHQGLKSTHEAIFSRVPMASYTFFSDQPGLAARCRELGLSLALAEESRAELGPSDLGEVLAEIEASREAMAASLEEARGWELRVIEGRAEVVDRVAAIGGA